MLITFLGCHVLLSVYSLLSNSHSWFGSVYSTNHNDCSCVQKKQFGSSTLWNGFCL